MVLMENILIIQESIWLQIDEVIGQAQATRAVLGSQRSLFSDVQGKVKNLGDKFPVIRGLLGISIQPLYMIFSTNLVKLSLSNFVFSIYRFN